MKDKWYEWALFACILLIAGYVRFSGIDSAHFLGDQNRDMLRTLGIVEGTDLPLTGAELSVMYRSASIGPLQYYIMAVPMFFSKNPVFMSVFIAFLNVLAVFLTFWLVRKYFSMRAALIASGLFAVSTTAVLRSQIIWNPSFFPFLTILFFFTVFEFVFGKKSVSFVWMMAALAAVTQFQAVMNVFFLVAGFVIVFWRPKLQKKHIIAGIAVFLLLYSPYIYNEFANHFPNSSALIYYVGKTAETNESKPFNFEVFTYPYRLISKSGGILSGIEIGLFFAGVVFLLFGSIYCLIKRNPDVKKYSLLLFWLGLPILFWSIFNQQILEHYFLPLYPVQFIIIGIFSDWLWAKADYRLPENFKPLVSILFIILFSAIIFSHAQYESKKHYAFFTYRYVVPAVQEVLEDAQYNPVVIENNIRFCSRSKTTLGFEYLFYYYGLGKEKTNKTSETIYVLFGENLGNAHSDVLWVKEGSYGIYRFRNLVAFNAWRDKLPEGVACRCVMTHQYMSVGGLCHRDEGQKSLFL